MVETFTPAVCGGRVRKHLAAVGFTIGAVAASAVVGGLLGLVGFVLGWRWAVLAAAAVALAAAFRELGLVRLSLPQVRHQVPDRWRAELPLPVWSVGYGAGLGVGFFTFQPVATFWVACAAAVALARPLPAAACFALYGVGRALTVLWPKRDAALACERLARRRPALLRANAIALAVCAALLGASPAVAAPRIPIGTGFDPSVSGSVLARAQVVSGVPRVVVEPGGEPPVAFDGVRQPYLDGELVALKDPDGIRVSNWRTGEIVAQVAGTVSRPALDWPLLAFVRDDGLWKQLVLRDLAAGTERVAATLVRTNDIGRPSLADGRLAWHVVTRSQTRIVVLNLASWKRRTIARSRIAVLMHPALSAGRVLWIDQSSRMGFVRMRALSGRRVRTRTLWTANGRDRLFWTTALAGRTAYVTRWSPVTRASTLLRLDL
ncbi:MAG: hypothetical protein ACRDM8_09300 [Gaiellaceae bacterium]